MMELWKKRGTSPSLGHMHRHERELVEHVERGIDEGTRSGGLIEEIMLECRARAATRPTDASWRFMLGRFLLATGSPLEAQDELEAAAVLDPRDPRISAHLAAWYAAAFAAATGECNQVDLPAGAGPDLIADIAAFARTEERANLASLSARCLQFIEVTRKFAISGSDQRALEALRDIVRLAPVEAQATAPLAMAPMSRAG